MTFLPIAERELRVAARRPGIYWVRWLAALGMLMVLLMLATARGGSPAQLSKNIFLALGIISLGFSLLAGVFLTADCLSEEKREGTLGLLFLTDLRGYDVVLGKLIVTSVHSVYGLLAMFPVLALPLLMGGVTVGEFWRVVLVLAATLLLSLGMGMFASAVAREAREAMAATFLGMLLLAGMLPALWWLGDAFLRSAPPTAFMWPSPPNTFSAALDANYRLSNGPHEFWASFLIVAGLGLGLLALAGVLLPRAWQEKARGGGAHREWRRPKFSSSVHSFRPSEHPHCPSDTNPYLWLARRVRTSDFLAAILFGLLVLFWFCCLLGSVVAHDSKLTFIVALFSAYALHQVGKYLVAVDASRQFLEDRRNGALELLLVTPLGEDQILHGQRRALKSRSQGLKAVLALVNVAMCVVVLLCPTQLSMDTDDQAIFLEFFLGGIVVLMMDFRALQTVGMWMGLRSRKHQRAVLGTLARVMLVPWAAVFLWVFLSISDAFSPSEGELGFIFALWFGVGIINDLMAAAKAQANLDQGLRHWVAETRNDGDWKRFLAEWPSRMMLCV